MNNLPVLDEWVAILNLCCVAVAVVANWWSARSGLLKFRTVHAAIATVSMIYVVLYAWLLGWVPWLEAPEIPTWSSVGRGISLVAWTVVWISPAVISIRMNRELHRAIKQRLDSEDDE